VPVLLRKLLRELNAGRAAGYRLGVPLAFRPLCPRRDERALAGDDPHPPLGGEDADAAADRLDGQPGLLPDALDAGDGRVRRVAALGDPAADDVRDLEVHGLGAGVVDVHAVIMTGHGLAFAESPWPTMFHQGSVQWQA